MSKFFVGQKVLVTGKTYYNRDDNRGRSLVGKICEIKKELHPQYAVWEEDKSDWWLVNESDLQPITETPKEITLNGATYVLKEGRNPDHEWKFGDVAVHDKYGVGIVTDIGERLEFTYANGEKLKYLNRSELTFLRQADLSV